MDWALCPSLYMPLTILVVDDDLGMRLAVGDYLETQGYFVVAAEQGIQALQYLSEHHPQLVITDIAMPQMDGYELVRQVRRNPALRLLPVIFLTGKTETPDRVLGYQLGCDVYLEKPFELAELGAVVRNVLDRAQTIASEIRFSSPGHLGAMTDGRSSSYAKFAVDPQSGLEPSAEQSAEQSLQRALQLGISDREYEVLLLLSDGLSNNQIGDRLHLSPRTIEKHVSSLLRKTETSNRAELVRFSMEHHLMD
jgi:DNA-binding NarL/FixJ family response regulator